MRCSVGLDVIWEKGAMAATSLKAPGRQVPEELLGPLVAYYQPHKVILFGSQARGAAIVACRASVFERKRGVVGSLSHTADQEGVIVYEYARNG